MKDFIIYVLNLQKKIVDLVTNFTIDYCNGKICGAKLRFNNKIKNNFDIK